MKKKTRLLDLIMLQGVVMIYSINTVIAKFVSDQEFMSAKFIALYFCEFAVLGVYAILWQQMIKKFELSIAYANKAMTLLWSLLWSIIIFHDGITPAKIVGVLLVIAGTVVINSQSEDDKKSESILSSQLKQPQNGTENKSSVLLDNETGMDDTNAGQENGR